MNADDSENEVGLQEQLHVLEQQIEQVAATAAELRRRLGQGDDEPDDPEGRTATLTAAEEQEAILAVLEQRRQALLERLSARSHRQ